MKGIPHHNSSSLYILYSLLSSPECKSQSIVHIYPTAVKIAIVHRYYYTAIDYGGVTYVLL